VHLAAAPRVRDDGLADASDGAETRLHVAGVDRWSPSAVTMTSSLPPAEPQPAVLVEPAQIARVEIVAFDRLGRDVRPAHQHLAVPADPYVLVRERPPDRA
jgi:hypothetical protein